MNAKEYLTQVSMIDARLKTIEANIKKIRQELYKLDDISLSSTWGDGQPHSTKPSDPTGTKAVKLADTPNEKKRKLKARLVEYEFQQINIMSELWSTRMDIINMISSALDPSDRMSHVYYKILTMKYIENQTWEEIAVTIGYTIRHTWRLHGEALTKIERMLNNG